MQKTLLKSQRYALSNKNELGPIHVIGSYKNLLDNKLKGLLKYKEIKPLGNFGLGTFDFVDGEMIALDGNFYRANEEGDLTLAEDTRHCPFAIVCQFNEQKAEQTEENDISLKDFQKKLLNIRKWHPTQSIAMAIKIDIAADWIEYRSEENSDEKASFDHVISQEKRHRHEQQAGTLVGFYFDNSLNDLTSSEFHFHYVNANKSKGGHLYDCHLQHATAYIQYYTSAQIEQM